MNKSNIHNKNSDKFITIYNELDQFMRNKLNVDDTMSNSELIRKMANKYKIFNRYKDDLLAFSRLRNAIVHNANKKDADPIAEPHEFIVKKFEEFKNNVISPPIALETIAIKAKDIFTARMDDNVIEVMKKMNENTFTHVPVIENNKLIGVFSENTVFSYVAKNEEVIIEKDFLIKDFAEFIPIECHVSEYFKFVEKKTLVADIEEIFSDGIEVGKRIAAIFITETGSPDERLLGLVTAWDLAGYTDD